MENLTHTAYKTIQYFENSVRCIAFHETVIYKQFPDGTIELNSSGFKTATTMRRINQQLPKNLKIYQKQYNWFVDIWQHTPEESPTYTYKETVKFFDGMQLVPTDNLESYTVKE